MKLIVAILLSLPNIGAYAILAVGIVMIYRASKVLNLAHGAMAMLPAYITYSLNKAGLPAVIAVTLGVVSGGLLGLIVERLFIRRLRSQSVTAQTVGTVAVLGVLVAGAAKIWGTTPLQPVRIFPAGAISISNSSIDYGFIGLFLVMLVVSGSLLLFFQKTDVGLLMRGTAENRRAASLMGVDPDKVTALAWILGGGLAGLAGILLASVTNLEPYTLSLQALYAFVAALFAGLVSLPGAVAGAALVGVTIGVVPILGKIGQVQGAPQLFLALIAIAVMSRRGGRFSAGDVRGEGVAATDVSGEPSRLMAAGKRPIMIAGLAFVVLFPVIPGIPTSYIGNANTAAHYTVVAVSLVLITGWVGQISLGHAALVGVGAYMTGHFAAGLGIPFPLNLPLAGLSAAIVAAVLGIVAVRVRGLYLAIATLIFSWMCDQFLFRQDWFVSHFRIDARNIGKEGTLPFFDFSNRRVFFYVAWAVAALAIVAAANMRDSKTGRAFFAVQGSETAAASLGIDVVRTKLMAFAISGFLAGVAGNLVMTEARTLSPDQFRFNVSFFFLAIAVVGGLSSLGGSVAAALLFASLNELFFRVRALGGYLDITSTMLLAVVLLAYSGGFARAGRTISDALGRSDRLIAILEAIDRRIGMLAEDFSWLGKYFGKRARARLELAGVVLPVESAGPIDLQPKSEVGDNTLDFTSSALAGLSLADRDSLPPRAALNPDRQLRPSVLAAKEVTVQFGGLVAVNGVNVDVREGEIVGLIGPNGAGKSVTFNSIAGLVVPTSGHIELYGNDVTQVPVHVRARMGVARTFQAIQLFPSLSVFENLLVATHLHNPTGVLSHITAGLDAIEAEGVARRRVQRIVDLLDLNDVASRTVKDLPFGVLRMVEVARAMVTGFKFMMLDEPASGLDNTETDRLVEVLRFVRDLGVTLLLIEHDVKMVTSLSDYIYVLDRGTLIAHGTPEVIQRDPNVIAAYLGQDDSVMQEV